MALLLCYKVLQSLVYIFIPPGRRQVWTGSIFLFSKRFENLYVLVDKVGKKNTEKFTVMVKKTELIWV